MLLLGARELAWGASIVAVRVWPADEYTRVTIESDAALSAKHFVADNPSRLVVDIDGLELSPALRELVGKVKPDDPFIAGVRVGQNQPRVVRLVFDLKQHTAPQVFTLAPVAAYRHRLVFDLYPTHAARPAAGADPREGTRRAAGRRGGAGRARRTDRQARQAAAAAAATSPPALAAGASAAAPPDPGARAERRRCWRRAGSTAWSSSRSTPATAAKTPAPSARAACARRTWCSPIALQLRERINANAGMRAMLTRDADFFVPLARARRKGAARAGRPVRLDPRRRLLHAAGARRVGVRAVSQGRQQQRRALDGRPRERRRPGRRRQRQGGRRDGDARPARHEHHGADQGQPEARQRGAGAASARSAGCTRAASSRPASRC